MRALIQARNLQSEGFNPWNNDDKPGKTIGGKE
jgi:hypothetical protein